MRRPQGEAYWVLTFHLRSVTELPIGLDLAGFVARVAAHPFRKVDSMATPRWVHGRAPAALHNPLYPSSRFGAPLSLCAIRDLSPLISVCGTLWSRRLRPCEHGDAVPGGARRPRTGAR